MIDRRHLEKEKFARRFIDAFSDFFDFSGKVVICTAILAASLTFFSILCCLSWEMVQPSSPIAPPILIEHLGFPFEGLREIYNSKTIEIPLQHMSPQLTTAIQVKINIEIVWPGLMADFIVYALLMFVIVKVISRIKDEIDFRRYDKK
jgi:hypothetical protein